MELLIVVILLVGLAVPPPRWGSGGQKDGLSSLGLEVTSGELNRPPAIALEAHRDALLRTGRAPQPALIEERFR